MKKTVKLYLLEALHRSLKHAKSHIHRATHYGETFLLKIENFVFFGVFYFKNKTIWHFQVWPIKANYCWSYGLPNLLFRFFRYHLGHFDNRQTKIVENSTIHFLKANTKISAWWKFQGLCSPTTKLGSFIFFAELNGNHILMANFSKLCEYQPFVLIELHNLNKA